MDVLGIFAKHPVVGRVKTRLAAGVGDEHAAKLYAAFIDDILAKCRAFPGRRVVCFTPDGPAAKGYFRSRTAADFELWPQAEEPLGERMRQFFAEQFDRGGRRVILIGSDSPTLPFDYLMQALALLKTNDCVLGPADDGGYYLVGQRPPLVPMFDGIDWGESTVLDQTLARIKECNARVGLLPAWYDVDTVAGLDRLREYLAAQRTRGEAPDIPHTARALEQ